MSVVGSLMFTVLMDTVEMSRFPSALGLLAIMESITLLIGPPLAGILVDVQAILPCLLRLQCRRRLVRRVSSWCPSTCWIRKRGSRRCRVSRWPVCRPDPVRPVDVAPGCQYSSVPTEGDKDKVSGNGPEYITSLVMLVLKFSMSRAFILKDHFFSSPKT
ncbi:hypothetical protein INR49_006408 [Caranx melampygus]|nr:hypothetical protein INR49_006408 [Caranx melampygus]